ncbi:hypothetical protein B0H17DRAFT_1208370 [Mycena rosella]|uniref:C3H1-type domain-containing protein n=1 Tax=Mycena rosella TaxID=1033263 RepID=A0AAD7G6Y2_MYCRO|nr:hypothetical protein B0H17DRAFT_1208370 [Mycena rosella]
MSPPPSPSVKKAPHKKRHTKPCRYFQTGRCPKAQEDCDFAHVYSDPPTLAPPKQCRYYLQGICTNGIWCQYRHAEGSSEDGSLLVDYRNVDSLSVGRDFDGRANPQVRVGVVPPIVYVPNTFNGMYVSSPPGPWSPYADGFHTPPEFAPSPQFFAPNPTISPAASFDSMDCATPSSSPTSSVSDDGVPFSADEPSGNHYSYFNTEPQTPYLSPPYADDASRSQFPRYSPRVPLSVMPATYGMTPMYDIFSPKAPSSATFYSTTGFPPESPCTPINRLKLASYRTKPCRYFKPGSVCPNGDACTFIHADPEQTQSPSPSPVKLQHELPSKPVSTKEENTRKGYFPISWRVIGGGVLMSGGKEDGSMSDDADSDLSDDSFEGRADPVSRVLQIDIPFSAPATAVEFPSMDTEDSDNMTPTGFSSRQRASSIPSTPMTTHVDLFRLFSAESPGGL